MTRDAIRAFCLKLPHATEVPELGMHYLGYKIGGKTFALLNLEPQGNPLCFKCTPEEFAEMIEMEGVIPAPYLARGHWVAITDWNALPATELKAALTRAHATMAGKLSKKLQVELGFTGR